MTNLLQLSGKLVRQPRQKGGGGPKFRASTEVTCEFISGLKRSLQKILEDSIFHTINGVLLSVRYKEVVAKSNRIKGLFAVDYKDQLNDHIRGAKYDHSHGQYFHVFTYYFKKPAILKAIDTLQSIATILAENFDGKISTKQFEKLNESNFHSEIFSRSEFMKILSDLSYIEAFDIDRHYQAQEQAAIVSFYRTDIPTAEILSSIGLDNVELINGVSAYLRPEDQAKVQSKIPYLVSMQVRDLQKFCQDHKPENLNSINSDFPLPKDEPVVGVIDTLFDETAYFSSWVEYHCYVNGINLDRDQNKVDMEHGTNISSIIVDGPSLNPLLDDDCGRFKVRHFGVCLATEYSSFTIVKQIEDIIKTNRDIKVWNLSLGSREETNLNSISPEAAVLDFLQEAYDVIFVVSGTNDENRQGNKKLGAPADSINSLVVNSVKRNGAPCSYYRNGPILSFFRKPDVSYYGGDENEKIIVYGPNGKAKTCGTSFAAAWVTRKVAFLIYKMGFSKEIAKALIIDSAIGWKNSPTDNVGFGIVPIKIRDVIEGRNDEIRFIISDISQTYETFSYDIPVPMNGNKHPFYARATMCYFPKCAREQGVDYTSAELDLHFGRVTKVFKNNKFYTVIKSIDANLQDANGFHNLKEDYVRDTYRKWDNVKVIRDTIKSRPIARTAYENGFWGLNVKSKSRLSQEDTKKVPFAVVLTLKEMEGKNRVGEFIKSCVFRGWFVEVIDIENQINIYSKASEEIVLF